MLIRHVVCVKNLIAVVSEVESHVTTHLVALGTRLKMGLAFANQVLAVESEKGNPAWKHLVVFGSLTRGAAKNARTLEKRANATTHPGASGIIALALVAVMRYEPSNKNVTNTSKKAFLKRVPTCASNFM